MGAPDGLLNLLVDAGTVTTSAVVLAAIVEFIDGGMLLRRAAQAGERLVLVASDGRMLPAPIPAV